MFTGYGHCYRLDALEHTVEHESHPHWTLSTLKRFKEIVTEPDFPCLFGRKAVMGGSGYIVFARADEPANDIACGLTEYVRHLQTLPLRHRIGAPLLVFLEDAGHPTLDVQQAYAWQVLQAVHARDPQPWPQAVPRDPHDNRWSFCFGGLPLFVNMSFPAHRVLRSRQLGDSIAFVINPRDSFDAVASARDESGVRIRARIRERVARYNQAPASETLGFFGEEGNFEWQQYQLQEPGSLNPARCPFHTQFVPAVAADALIET